MYINYDSDAGGSNDGIFFARDGEDEAGTVDVVIKEGNVGIGTTDPGATFQVGADTRNDGAAVQTQAGYFIGAKSI